MGRSVRRFSVVASFNRGIRSDHGALLAAYYSLGSADIVCLELLLHRFDSRDGLNRYRLHEVFAGGRSLPILRHHQRGRSGGGWLGLEHAQPRLRLRIWQS